MAKKFLQKVIFFIVISALGICGITASADSVYDIGELDMSVAVPDEYMTFTRDISDDDPNLKMFLSKTALLSQMEEADLYLLALSADTLDEITVTMIENDESQEVFDFNNLTTGMLEKSAEESMAEDENAKSYTIEEHEQVRFIKMNSSQVLDDNTTVYTVSYVTAVNGKFVTVGYSSYNGSITEEEEAVIDSVAQSVSFGEILAGGKADYKQFTNNLIILGAVVLVFAVVIVIIVKRRQPKKSRLIYTMPEAAPSEPALKDAEYTPQIAVHILDEDFGYNLVNWDDAKEFADFVDEQNSLYLHKFVDENGKRRTEAMQYSAWMSLKREHDESHFIS